MAGRFGSGGGSRRWFGGLESAAVVRAHTGAADIDAARIGRAGLSSETVQGAVRVGRLAGYRDRPAHGRHAVGAGGGRRARHAGALGQTTLVRRVREAHGGVARGAA